jgi:predicted AAA+ superfamily ATPase
MLLSLVKEFYKAFGVGMLGLNTAFRIAETAPGSNNRDTAVKNSVDFQIGRGISCTPIKNTDKIMLDDLIGYDIQKTRLRENTESFLSGKPANNVLLYGDAGTGKSTSIKALINEYYDDGLRMIELYKHQMKLLAPLITSIKNRNYRFIVYMDDLSFEESELEYKYLKAIIEGGLEPRPDNVLIYATSNRRHLVRESFKDRADADTDDIHRNDTIQEKLSLSKRFGIQIGFFRPNPEQYKEIVRVLAKRHPEIVISDEELMAEASRWELSHGGISGRAAQQFVDYLSGRK